jgi:hypothetical protein
VRPNCDIAEVRRSFQTSAAVVWERIDEAVMAP